MFGKFPSPTRTGDSTAGPSTGGDPRAGGHGHGAGGGPHLATGGHATLSVGSSP